MNCKPRTWWKEVKTLGGMKSATRTDPVSVLTHVQPGPNSSPTVNEVFLEPISNFTPLGPVITADARYSNPVSEFCVQKKLSVLNPAKSSGPDMIPSWLLTENADLLAPAVTDIINCSFAEAHLPQSWKQADIVLVPKQVLVYDVNKHLRPISLTPVLSKVAEEFVVEQYVKPAVLEKVDPGQFGTIPGSSTTEALISMTHVWYKATDGNGATVRAVLFDFKKAFDLIDHEILVQKLRLFNIPEAIILWITDFLSCRKQRVKLGQDCFSEWRDVPAGVPQGTKLDPWLFIIMINDLDIPGFELWKYVDDSTISETILKAELSNVQTTVDIFASHAASDKFQLNETKCKEMRICFSTNGTPDLNPIVINDKQIDVVSHTKILGVNILSDLKWNHHIAEVVKKARKCLFCLSQLKRTGLGPNELVQFYRTCIRPITEYACPLFHDGLPVHLSHELEAVQKRAMRIIFPSLMYDEALIKTSLVTLSDRRQALTDKMFKKILDNKDSKFRNLLPPQNAKHYNLRKGHQFNPVFKTNRFRNSFIVFNALKVT